MARKMQNMFKPSRSSRATPRGNSGYDNPRENIDPQIKTQTVSTRQGSIEKTPTEPNDIVNKKYVDDLTIGTHFDFYAYDDVSDIAGYKEFKLTPSPDAKVEGDISIPGNATAQEVGKRITEDVINIPELMTVISTGVATFHIHFKAATANRLKLFAKIYTRTALGVETLIATTNISEYISTVETHYNLHADITETVPLAAGDRLVVKAYASNSSPAATTLYIYVEGDTATRVNLPGITSPANHAGMTNLPWGDSGHSGDLVVEDHGTASTDQVVNVCYGTDATPPTASGTTEGALYFQYTA